MAEIALPAGPAELLEAVRETFARYVGGERHLRLGGGTALAARWRHRHSSDVDLFVAPLQFQRVFQQRDAFSRDARRCPGARAVSVQEQLATVLFRREHGLDEVSLVAVPSFAPQPRSSDTVRGTEVSLQTTAEILAKKLGYRMFRGRLVPRDFYDLATGRDRDPEQLADALRAIDTSRLEQISGQLDRLRASWMETHRQEVVRPADPDVGTGAVRIVKELLADELRSRPRLPPRDLPPRR